MVNKYGEDSVDFSSIIAELIKSGVSHKMITVRTGASYSTINRLQRGESVNPSYSVGSAIVKMHKMWCVK